MANTSSKTASKTVKTLATYVSEFKKISDTFESKIRKAESDKVDAQAKLVAEMSIKGGYSDVKIAEALGITKDYAGKLVARGIMVASGMDGVDGYKLLTTQGNKVTVSTIKKIGSGNRKIADIKEDLRCIGVPERNAVKRVGAVGKAKVAPIVNVRKSVENWVARAESGKLDAFELATILQTALDKLIGE